MPAGDAAVELAVRSAIEQARGTFADAACAIDGNMVSSRGRGERAPFGDGLLGVLAGVAAT